MMLKNDNLGKLFLRIAVAVIILFHGWFKLTHGVGWIQSMLGGMGFLAYGITDFLTVKIKKNKPILEYT